MAGSARLSDRAGLVLVLGAALAVRLWILATDTYVVWPDETFQYLEPAHRLVFGSGVITWEYLDGIRSWLLPGMLAGVMWLVSLADPAPGAYIFAARLLCVLASLSVPFVGYRLVRPRFGAETALLAGLLCGLAPDPVYFAPVILAEPLAVYVALLAIWLGDGAGGVRPGRWRLLATGLLFGFASALRFQYAPTLAVVALLQHRRSVRDLALVAAGGAAVVVAVLGGLDWLSWGTPFQSVWLNYVRNAIQGVSAAMGTQPWYYYGAYISLSWGVAAPVLLACAALGAIRMPVLAAAVVCTIGLHSLTPHKELRFVFLAMACLPMLVGVGLGALLQGMRRLGPAARGALAAACALAISGYTAFATDRNARPADAWHRGRSVLQVTEAARDVPGACGLGVRTIGVYVSGGYTYWHRGMPIFFATWDASQTLEHSAFPMRLASVLEGHPVPQVPDAAFAAHSDAFNVLIGTPSDGLPGFSKQSCYGAGTLDDHAYCVFTRPGGCG